MADALSDVEWEELSGRIRQLSPDTMMALILEGMAERGRIPTPVDDGFSGWFDRTLNLTDEQRMQTRVVTGMWRWMLTTLRERQAAEKGGV